MGPSKILIAPKGSAAPRLRITALSQTFQKIFLKVNPNTKSLERFTFDCVPNLQQQQQQYLLVLEYITQN